MEEFRRLHTGNKFRKSPLKVFRNNRMLLIFQYLYVCFDYEINLKIVGRL